MRTRAVALAAATATALSGCSMLSLDGDSSGSSESSESSDSSESAQDSGGDSGDATTQTALAAGIDPEDPPKAIAEGTFKPNSDDVESTKIELVKLTPKDNVMLAVFRFTGEGRGNQATSIFSLLGSHSFRPELIDLENLEKYSVVGDLNSDVNTRAPLGEPMYYFTAFPLPRDGVESMDLRMTEQMGAIEDVPMPKS